MIRERRKLEAWAGERPPGWSPRCSSGFGQFVVLDCHSRGEDVLNHLRGCLHWRLFQ